MVNENLAVCPIVDADDPRIEPYRDLRRDADARRRGFIAEGWVVLEKALGFARYPLASILVAEPRLDRLAALLEGLPETPRVYAASQALLDRIAGFPVHRGVLAHGLLPALPSADDLLGQLGGEALVVCAVGVGDPDNMGALFRNAAAFGVRAVILDAQCCDPLYRRAIRVSVGAALGVPFARLEAGEDLLATLGRHRLTALALTPSGATPLKALASLPRVALLVGAEGPGLPPSILQEAQTVRIPMAGGFDSLNVATALAVALHHLSPATAG